MPEPQDTGDRTPAQRQADHASLARLSETLVPALVAKLTGTGLGELEVRVGDWKIRVRRPAGSVHASPARRSDRPRLGGSSEPRTAKASAVTQTPSPSDPRRAVVTSPAVGTFRPGMTAGSAARADGRIGVVDQHSIPQD